MAAEKIQLEHTLAGLLQDFCGPAVRRDIRVTGLAIDSRKVQSGDLFLAVAGTQTHGLQHARQAVALGAVAVAWEPVEGNAGLAEMAALLPTPVVAIPKLGQVIGLIADRFYGHPSRGMFMV
ncbi:MAG: Mur ligase domain-containing protein, partial [Gammaproteobacteria bacterium]